MAMFIARKYPGLAYRLSTGWRSSAPIAVAFEINRVVPGLAPRGQLGDDSGSLDTGDGADLREKPVKELFPVHWLRVECAGEADVDGENVVGVESFIDLQQSCEAGTKKAGDDQQRGAQPDFEADQGFAKAQAAASFGEWCGFRRAALPADRCGSAAKREGHRTQAR